MPRNERMQRRRGHSRTGAERALASRMLDGLKNYWKELKRGQPGKRFQQQYRKNHQSVSKPVRKVIFIGGGLLIIAAAIFFLPAPGPGWAVIFIGGGLLAQESLPAAKTL